MKEKIELKCLDFKSHDEFTIDKAINGVLFYSCDLCGRHFYRDPISFDSSGVFWGRCPTAEEVTIHVRRETHV